MSLHLINKTIKVIINLKTYLLTTSINTLYSFTKQIFTRLENL